MAFSLAGRALYTANTFTDPTTYSLECWFRSAGVNGGAPTVLSAQQVSWHYHANH
jgi:hypothetical protein